MLIQPRFHSVYKLVYNVHCIGCSFIPPMQRGEYITADKTADVVILIKLLGYLLFPLERS